LSVGDLPAELHGAHRSDQDQAERDQAYETLSGEPLLHQRERSFEVGLSQFRSSEACSGYDAFLRPTVERDTSLADVVRERGAG